MWIEGVCSFHALACIPVCLCHANQPDVLWPHRWSHSFRSWLIWNVTIKSGKRQGIDPAMTLCHMTPILLFLTARFLSSLWVVRSTQIDQIVSSFTWFLTNFLITSKLTDLLTYMKDISHWMNIIKGLNQLCCHPSAVRWGIDLLIMYSDNRKTVVTSGEL